MKILIAGHSALDEIHNGSNIHYSPGGLLYNAIGIAACSKTSDNVYLVTGIDDNYEKFARVYDLFNRTYCNENTRGVEVVLTVYSDREREEKYSNFPVSLKLPVEDHFGDFNGALFNFISGEDFSLNDMTAFRKNFSGIIYADLHSMTRGIDKNGSRYFRKIKNMEKWLNCFDIIQVNENEAASVFSAASENNIASFVLKHRPEIFIITKGDRGARLFYRNSGELCSELIAAEKVNIVNTVGCGDIFGSFFFYHYVAGYDKLSSLRYGTKAAAKLASLSDRDDPDIVIKNLRNDEKNKINDHRI